jgi:hypothetical protein
MPPQTGREPAGAPVEAFTEPTPLIDQLTIDRLT